jgi:hypothetical protein
MTTSKTLTHTERIAIAVEKGRLDLVNICERNHERNHEREQEKISWKYIIMRAARAGKLSMLEYCTSKLTNELSQTTSWIDDDGETRIKEHYEDIGACFWDRVSIQAARSGNTDCVAYCESKMQELGTHLNAYNEFMNNAIDTKSIDVVRYCGSFIKDTSTYLWKKAVIHAAKVGEMDIILHCLSQMETVKDNGWIALFLQAAARNGRTLCIKYGDIHLTKRAYNDEINWTSVAMCATDSNNAECIEYCIHKITVDNTTHVIRELARQGNLHHIKYCENYFADQDLKVNWIDAMYASAAKGHFTVLKYCEHKAINSNTSTDPQINWNIVLNYCGRVNDLEIIDYCIANGATEYNFVISNAASKNNLNVLQYCGQYVEDDVKVWEDAICYSSHSDLVIVEYCASRSTMINWKRVRYYLCLNKNVIKYVVAKELEQKRLEKLKESDVLLIQNNAIKSEG